MFNNYDGMVIDRSEQNCQTGAYWQTTILAGKSMTESQVAWTELNSDSGDKAKHHQQG